MNLSLSLHDLAAISPLLILLIGALSLLVIESFATVSAKKIAPYIALFTLLLALYAAFVAPVSNNPLLTSWIKFDPLGRFFTLFFLVIGIASTCLAHAFFDRFESQSIGEYFFLLLSAVFGLILIGLSADFLTLFLGIETLSISLYILCGYMKMWKISHEASLKYFLMGALATAFLIYGIALVYGAVGSTRFDALLPGYQALTGGAGKTLFLSGIALITLALVFEAAVVPFHVWAPDVYDGASTPVTAFMAVGTKVGAFAALVRVFFDALPHFDVLWNEAISYLAYPTLIYANFVALRQTQLRRFFAYSGISNAGFLLIPFAAGTGEALPALLFYLVVYAIATLGAFAVIAFLDKRSNGVFIHDLYGLFERFPLQAGILVFCLLTLAGIPPTAGFFAKFYIFKVAFQAGYYALVIVGLLTTILSAFYYLRMIGVMFSQKPDHEETFSWGWSSFLVGLAACGALVWLSIYPEPVLSHLLSLSFN
jgi:NADH-quinone oxidoreductase subunit N